jgi:SAM-dependent methyltransferase
VADGLALLIGGHSYARLWEAVPSPALFRRSARWFTELPPSILRLIGLGETALGFGLLDRTPVTVEELYGLGAAVYDPVSVVWRQRLHPDIHQAFDSYLTQYLPSGGSVLDLGCGTGANLERLLDLNLRFGSYIGVDQSEAMLDRARNRFGHLHNVSFRRLDLLADPLPEGPFDLVVCTWVFSHLPDPGRVVEETMKRLKEGGHVVLLFIARSGGRQALLRPPLAFFSTYPVSQDAYLDFPGRVHLERFCGGSLVAMVLRKGS